MHYPRRDRAQLVTEARLSRSADIAYRERRYLIMMGIRLVCFVIAIVLFTNGGGWLTAIPAVGAIIIPYFAVIFANGSREPVARRSFQAYEQNLPQRFAPEGSADGSDARRQGSGPPGSGSPGSGSAGPDSAGSGSGESRTAGNNGESGRTS
jgi:hypothetical protein